MFEIQEFLKGLDQIYQERRIDQVESYLLNGLKQAGEENKEETLLLLNELMGYYRAVSRHEDMIRCAHRVQQLVEELHQQETLNHATTLLNIATGYRAAGRYEEAEADYRKAQAILEARLTGPDYRLATLHNNLGLLYAQTQRLAEAKAEILQSLPILRQLPDMETEEAITYTNLGNVCFGLGQAEEATGYMQKAIALFEKNPGSPDPHYPAALAGLAAACFHKGELEDSAAWFEKALVFIEKLYGRNDDWNTTYENLQMVRELIQRRDAMTAKNRSGLELARMYYEEVGRPMLERKYPLFVNRIAVGLVGEGSECLGYDDALSTDHDFGPGFCLWLTHEDYEAIGAALQADYEALPSQWRGLPVRNTTREGAGRVGVWEIDSFYRELTGHAEAPDADTPEGLAAWCAMAPEMLRTAVNGEVFRDDLGLFCQRRRAFSHYPEKARLTRLAAALHTMAQAGQYNYSRGKKRGDLGMMYNSLAEFLKAAAETGYLLNRSYMPYYKWRARGMEEFTAVKELRPMLEELMVRPADGAGNEDRIETICAYVRRELKAQGLTDTEDAFLDVQKDAVLRRLKELQAPAAPKKVRVTVRPCDKKERLVEEIVAAEWEQFQEVDNEGGRASCQNNWPTFQIMRKSQFFTWDEEVLESYLGDLREGREIGWNLITEKYARMMEHTAPEQYKVFADRMPPLDPERVQIQEQLIAVVMNWTAEMQARYPALSGNGRNPFSAQDSQWDTSSETYLRGELSTYSDATLRLYGRMIVRALRAGENLVEQNITHMVHFYGYPSLEAAEESCRKQQLF